ncbi:MAG: GGDEF domain-containing protein [Epulopiscium sp.]|nr:GGDEF domain-containing protein [Candidatus Epulonipiscium sp.]
MNYFKFKKKKLIQLIKKKDRTIQKLKEENKKLSYYASRDDMTHLWNRRMGMEWLNEEIYRCRFHNDPITICFIDLDNLKQINDQFGHQQGDRFIKAFSILLKKQIRKGDKAFRMGGDEFMIIFPNTTKEEATHIVNRIHQKIHDLNQKQILPFIMSFSHGLCEYTREYVGTVSELINQADQDMYRSKGKKNK